MLFRVGLKKIKKIKMELTAYITFGQQETNKLQDIFTNYKIIVIITYNYTIPNNTDRG